MGVVCVATHLHLGTPVAVKLIRADLKHDPDAIVRFHNEARAAAALKGEHIARVYDFGQLETGEPYLVMEHLEGMGLDAFLAERGPLTQSEAVDIVLQACDGLAEAHAVSLVHRDIKAANLFLSRRPDGQFLLKILDFGIAKRLVDGALSAVTNPKSSVGSPWYMPPEQMLDAARVDQRADVWSLGVLLYELLTQSYPFNGDSLVQVCANVLTAPTPSVRASRPDVDERVQEVIERCLEKTMERRFGSVLELADALRPFGSRPEAPASVLAPSEGLSLDVPSEVPVSAAADAPVRLETPISIAPRGENGARENATPESYAPMTVHRHRRARRRQRTPRAPRRKHSLGWLTATALFALLLGVGLTWMNFPYVHARYRTLTLRELERTRLPFDPSLNPGPRAAPRDRAERTPEFMVPARLASAVPSLPAPVESSESEPALTPEEAQRRAERYELWLREQGLTRLNGEWTQGDSAAPPN